jgi:hypothetical protein
MNKLFLLLFYLPLASAPLVPVDKQLHFAAGMIVSGVTMEIAKRNGWKHPKLWGVGAAVGVGLLKEVYDKQHPKTNTCDPMDALATGLGGLTVSYTWRF